MGRRRIYQRHTVPGTVVSLVQAIIQDYPRRKKLIEATSINNPNTNEECTRLNFIIEDTVNSHEPMLSAIIVSDIINCKGYDHSEASIIASKNLYYNLKHKIIEEIAIKVNLV
jgi:hypothetical protein